MAYITAALECMFGCHHGNLTRIFTIRKRSYRVCCDCGAEFRYSLESMTIQRRERSRSIACMPRLLRAR